MKYDFLAIENKWRDYWARNGTFKTPNPDDERFDSGKPKYYVLAMFPYPSGAGMHVGHALNYTSADIVARYKLLRGFNVLHPIGYDAFGLPAEQYAVEHGVHPAITTQQNIDAISTQLRRLGLSFDWDRCLATTDPDYYRWTQWIFLQLYNAWFDPGEDEHGRAKPIGELVQLLESERFYVGPDGELVPTAAEGLDAIGGPPFGARKWHELSVQEQRCVINSQRLAFIGEVSVNWCPALGTVLANEEVTHEGRSERGNHPVFQRPLKQWMLRITAYAERLRADLDLVDWPEPIKLMQRNWIGRSEGAMVDFDVVGCDEVIRVFTTRPDTLFGATYMVLSPEHPLVDELTTDEHRQDVQAYQQQAAARTDIDRMAEGKTKTGVFTGTCATNPTNAQQIPIWIADYVLMGYGTGAIMAVPAHDQRDYEFAKTFDLAITCVVRPDDDWLKAHDVAEVKDFKAAGEAFVGEGANMNSTNDEVSLDGLAMAEAMKTITHWLVKGGIGKAQVQYKLREWLFSRQRYWGEPFPILHGPDEQTLAVDETELPVQLPELEDYTPHTSDDPDAAVRTPLSRAPDSWKLVQRDGVQYERELNTMPQWAGSCWYYLRFCDPKNTQRFVSEEAEQYWMRSAKASGEPHAGGVDLYIGGVEHAVLHLLYARFWHKVLYDLGHVCTPEPFGRLFNQGYVLAAAYTDERGMYVPAEQVEEKDGKYVYQGRPVEREFGKMGKSLKNSVSPDDMCDEYGADTLRLYLMYMGPLDASKPWNARDIIGVHRFLQRLWRNLVNEQTGTLLVASSEAPAELRRKLHKTIKRTTDAMDSLCFNVAIAALIELNNDLVPLKVVPREVAEAVVIMLAPLAPHVAEEMWHRLGHEQAVAHSEWPTYDPELLVEQQIEYPVQINGKVRARITVDADADDNHVEQTALANDSIKQIIGDQQVHKVIIIKGRMVNIVVK